MKRTGTHRAQPRPGDAGPTGHNESVSPNDSVPSHDSSNSSALAGPGRPSGPPPDTTPAHTTPAHTTPADTAPTGVQQLAATIATRSRAAYDRIGAHLVRTPLVPDPVLSKAIGGRVDIKAEHLQMTGSFKVRGALAKISALQVATGPASSSDGVEVVTASSGNHGLAVAHALEVLGGKGTVCVPEGASPAKVARIRATGTPLLQVGEHAGQSEEHAAALAAERGIVYVSPYDDDDVIAGQGTVGLEIAEDAESPYDVAIIAVGGGGLIAGAAATLKDAWPSIRVVGAQPAHDAAMSESVRAGEIIEPDASPTLSDGTAGPVAPGARTFALCRDLVDEWVLVCEDEIAAAMAHHIDVHHQLVEGSAGVALAAVGHLTGLPENPRVVVISCGANIGAARLVEALGRR